MNFLINDFMTPTVMAMHSPRGSAEAHGALQAISLLSPCASDVRHFMNHITELTVRTYMFCSKMY